MHGFDVVEDRVLAQVVADHRRHVRVDELVVGHAVAHGVRDRHPPGPRRVDDAWAADERFGTKLKRIEVIVVDAAVDDVNRYLTLGGAKEHVGPVAHEIASLDEMHAHEACSSVCS